MKSHPAFRGYDAVRGKCLDLSPNGRVYRCAICERPHSTREDREAHMARAHGVTVKARAA